jgi:hypothetical protein
MDDREQLSDDNLKNHAFLKFNRHRFAFKLEQQPWLAVGDNPRQISLKAEISENAATAVNFGATGWRNKIRAVSPRNPISSC